MFSKSKSEDKATAEVVSLKSDDMSTLSADPDLPPYTEIAPVQSFEVKYKDWKCTKALAKDPKSNTTQYNIDLPTFKRCHINLRSIDTDAEIASSNPFCLKKHISANARGQDLNVRYEKMLTCKYSYISPAFDNTKLIWKCQSKLLTDMQYVLVDEQNLPVARWRISGPKVGPFKDLGRIEFLTTKADSEAAREEILITGLTVVYLEIVARSQGTIGISALGTMAAVAAQ